MDDPQNPRGGIGSGTLAAIVAAFVLALALLAWGPWSTTHVAVNPGPSGTPGSTVVEQAPPPAASPSGNTTGAAR
jgi:hypothetical protein